MSEAEKIVGEAAQGADPLTVEEFTRSMMAAAMARIPADRIDEFLANTIAAAVASAQSLYGTTAAKAWLVNMLYSLDQQAAPQDPDFTPTTSIH